MRWCTILLCNGNEIYSIEQHKFTLNTQVNMKCLCLYQGTASKSSTRSKKVLHLGPVRLLLLINLNLKTILLRSKSHWRIYYLCVDHSSESVTTSYCAADLPLGSPSRASQCHHPATPCGDIQKGDNFHGLFMNVFLPRCIKK